MEDVSIISSDEFRRRDKGPRLWDRMARMAEAQLSQGQIPLIDATNYTSAHRSRFIEVATKTGSRYIIVYLAARLDTLIDRNARREEAIPPGAIYRLSSLFEVPVGEDILTIDTETTSAEDAAAIIADEIRGLS